MIRSEPLIAVLPSGHRLAEREEVAIEELAEEPFIAYPSHLRTVLRDTVEEICAEHDFAPEIAMEVIETATLVSFVAAGIGLSIVPASVAGLTVAGAVYRPLAGTNRRVQIALAWLTGSESPLLERALPLVNSAVMRRPGEFIA